MDSFALLRSLQLPASDTIEFLDRAAFNFIVGNGDAHAKNFSVIYRNSVPRLSPAYDVMSTAIYPEVGRRMAMKIDGEYSFKWITRDKFVRMAAKSGISARIASHELDKMVRRVERALPVLVAKSGREFPHGVYTTVANGIADRIAKVCAGNGQLA